MRGRSTFFFLMIVTFLKLFLPMIFHTILEMRSILKFLLLMIIRSNSCSDSDSSDDSLSTKVASWAIEHKIPHNALSSLLVLRCCVSDCVTYFSKNVSVNTFIHSHLSCSAASAVHSIRTTRLTRKSSYLSTKLMCHLRYLTQSLRLQTTASGSLQRQQP